MFSLKGCVAVVIGGGGVVAGAMADGLAKAGADIAILDLSLENAQAAAQRAEALGVRSLALQLDATSKEGLSRAEAAVTEALGDATILINAPGVNSSTPFFAIPEEEFDKIMRVNLKSMFLACQIFGKKMVTGGKGGS
ncbi:SDR family NAD(P)-dependent oxidoreductase, partial [bacterium]|nr:SDR family NAD(P)-dependent oxidoreductase [bacterium]